METQQRELLDPGMSGLPGWGYTESGSTSSSARSASRSLSQMNTAQTSGMDLLGSEPIPSLLIRW